jgi:hypothetical protein
MYAYVYWHWPSPQAPREVYERFLIGFHESLGAGGSEGFFGSRVLRLAERPWSDPIECYEDWYYLASFAALERLNDAAVEGARRLSHDRVAAVARDAGAAGVFKLLHGRATAPGAPLQYWLNKPAGEPLDAFLADLGTIEGIVAVWQRQLVLGPGKEFCIFASKPLQFPFTWQSTNRTPDLLWSAE